MTFCAASRSSAPGGSEIFFNNGFDLAMSRNDCLDEAWAATIAAGKGPGNWYADADSLRYSFFDKIESDD
jgi:hypothetical protein